MGKQSETDQTSKSGGWLRNLEPLSRFIATHGLAVFLVVYYAVFLYPEAYRERGEWIQELTELRRAVAPETRPVSEAQATVILGYATDLFFETLESELQRFLFESKRTYYSWETGWGYEPGIRIFNQEFKINKKELLKPQVVSLMDRFKQLQSRARSDHLRQARLAIDKAIRRAQFSASRLQSFKFAQGTLEDIWDKSFSASFREFEDKYPETCADELGRNVKKDFMDFLAKNTQYTETTKLTAESESTETLISAFRKRVRQNWLFQLEGTRKNPHISSGV